jgi:hypothetical protein
MEIDYYSKYLKYKAKYLDLKKQMGGIRDPYNPYKCCKWCYCKEFKLNSLINNEENCKCGHVTEQHVFKYQYDSYINEEFRDYCYGRNKTNTSCCKCNCIKYTLTTTSKCTCGHELDTHRTKQKKCPTE